MDYYFDLPKINIGNFRILANNWQNLFSKFKQKIQLSQTSKAISVLLEK